MTSGEWLTFLLSASHVVIAIVAAVYIAANRKPSSAIA